MVLALALALEVALVVGRGGRGGGSIVVVGLRFVPAIGGQRRVGINES